MAEGAVKVNVYFVDALGAELSMTTFRAVICAADACVVCTSGTIVSAITATKYVDRFNISFIFVISLPIV